MTNEDIINEFEVKFKCITQGCDSNGSIAHQVCEDEWEQEQCQFCFEYLLPIKDFILKYLEAKDQELKRIVEVISDINFYDWNEATQSMIKYRIIGTLKKHNLY